eukprot:CAMPEP_0119102240 /NCGR_PEP_ID=MMETSP1180-20130426/1051_1 /TAXON_ID=3052 ORGANISM="Chlamydomonas cf sp, Strain CCMP681" /NCGR_SAMPLE_ID=MMETSP1180 /ASSEMBLY_ACC=CAM_ASM_000741 /LENGTH=339 /DNA_ID=CAMNT_0007086489 /DNA_START=69 /DNA_END=1088 /DNA_ORIENTATION=-
MATTQQTVVTVTAFNPASYLDTIQVTKAPIPSPGPGEALVALKLRPINPADVFSCMGVYPAFQPKSMPCTPGMEGVGVVSALGAGVTSPSVGTRVTAMDWPCVGGGNGLWQEYITIPANMLTVVPDDIPDDAAACAMVNPVSVLGMLDLVGPVPAGQYLIVTAAGSALGKMTLRLCKDRNIKTIGVVRRTEQFDELKAEGATAMVAITDNLVADIGAITGEQGAYAAMDCLCGDIVSKLCQAVKRGGTVVLYGAMCGPTFQLSVADTLFRQMQIKGYWCHLQIHDMDAATRAEYMVKIFDLYRRGIFVSGAGETMPLASVVEGLKAHSQTARSGKIMLA